jgi:hypothetical protein
LTSSSALNRTEELVFQPAVSRRFTFRTTASQAAEDVRISDIVFVLAGGGLSLRWDASTAAVSVSETGDEFQSVELGVGAPEITVLPPEAKASVVLEYDAPVLVDEFFAVTIVAAANEDTVQHGAVTIVPAPGDSTNCKVLSSDLSPASAEGVRPTALLAPSNLLMGHPTRLTETCGLLLCCVGGASIYCSS